MRKPYSYQFWEHYTNTSRVNVICICQHLYACRRTAFRERFIDRKSHDFDARLIHSEIWIMFDLQYQISRIYMCHEKFESLLYHLEKGTIKKFQWCLSRKFDLQVWQQPVVVAFTLHRNSSLQFCSMTRGMRGLRSKPTCSTLRNVVELKYWCGAPTRHCTYWIDLIICN